MPLIVVNVRVTVKFLGCLQGTDVENLMLDHRIIIVLANVEHVAHETAAPVRVAILIVEELPELIDTSATGDARLLLEGTLAENLLPFRCNERSLLFSLGVC